MNKFNKWMYSSFLHTDCFEPMTHWSRNTGFWFIERQYKINKDVRDSFSTIPSLSIISKTHNDIGQLNRANDEISIIELELSRRSFNVYCMYLTMIIICIILYIIKRS